MNTYLELKTQILPDLLHSGVDMNSIILTGLVTIVCPAHMLPDYRNACSSSIEATVRESGVYESIKKLEKKQIEKIERKTKSTLGVREAEIAAAAVVVAGILAGGNAIIKLGKGPVKGSYFLETDARSFRLGAGWDF